MENQMLFLTTVSNMTALTQNVFARKYKVKPCGFDMLEIECSIDDSKVDLVVVELKGVGNTEIKAFKEIKEELIDKNNIPTFLIGNIENKLILNEFLKFKDIVNLTNMKLNEIYDEIVKNMAYKGKNGKKKKIMLVDDDPMILRYMGVALKENYDVVMAPSGELAISLLKRTKPKPDLILLDYQMPHLDGAQTLTMIRESDEFTSIPVFFLTGVNDKDAILKVMTLRPQGYILKTMPQEEILRQIDKFFC